MIQKLISKSRVTVKDTEIDSVKRKQAGGTKECIDLLLEANRAWDALRGYREERERCKRYLYGDQWGDIIHHDGRDITEEEYIKEQGTPPLKNNLIRRLVRTVIGVHRGQDKQPTCVANDRDEQRLGEVMTVALQCNWKANRMQEMSGRGLEEFLLGGGIFFKETAGWRNDRYDCWTDAPNPKRIFFDGRMDDKRHWDLSLIGEIHDLSFEDLVTTFAKQKSDFNKLKEIYDVAVRRDYVFDYYNNSTLSDRAKLKNLDFLCPYDTTMCRVIEIWNKETKQRYHCHDYLSGEYYKIDADDLPSIEAENRQRLQQGMQQGMQQDDIPLIETEWFIDSYWYYRFLTPFGQVLDEGETPYAHKSHPYVIKLYPFVDGEVHSFESDVIDQQRYINRLITLNDFVIRASAKGVLLIPEEAIPDGMTPEDFTDKWAKFNGAIVFKSRGLSMLPQQIANKSTNIGIAELLQVELNLMEDVTGVTGALQGKPGLSGMSASLYQQQQQQASSSLLDILDSYDSFIIEDSIKKMKNIQQFYDSKRYITIAGKSSQGVIYNPEEVKDMEFDLSIYEGQNTPTARMASNEFLLEIFKTGQLTLEQLLECGTFPWADTLLQSVRANAEALQNGTAPAGIGQAEGMPQADPNAVQMLQGALKG